MSAGAEGRPFTGIRIVDFGVQALGLTLITASVLLTFTDPPMPRSDLDPACAMASEYDVSHGYVFGRGFIFNFAPYSVLSTRLFSASTWRLVLAFDILSVLAVSGHRSRTAHL